MPEFRPIVKTTISGEIVEQILAMIRSDGYKPGDRLPSERELCEAFQVGRSSVREAMKILEATGLVETSNKGKFIRTPKSQHTDILDTVRADIREVFEARKLIEIEMAALASQRATGKDLKNLEKTARLISEPQERHEAYAADIAFHLALVDAAHNSFFSEIYKKISGLLFQHFEYYSRLELIQDPSAYTSQIAPDHIRIFEAIKAHNPSNARRAVRKHLDHAEAKLLSALEQEKRVSNRA